MELRCACMVYGAVARNGGRSKAAVLLIRPCPSNNECPGKPARIFVGKCIDRLDGNVCRVAILLCRAQPNASSF